VHYISKCWTNLTYFMESSWSMDMIYLWSLETSLFSLIGILNTFKEGDDSLATWDAYDNSVGGGSFLFHVTTSLVSSLFLGCSYFGVFNSLKIDSCTVLLSRFHNCCHCPRQELWTDRLANCFLKSLIPF
jgi:hypothetical protein